MTLRTYQASSMAEALSQMKRELGRDAVILHTRSFRKGAVLGLLGGKPMWEITASPNVNVPPRNGLGAYLSAAGEAAGDKAPHALAAMASATAVAEEPVEVQVRQIRRMVESLLTLHASGTPEMPLELKQWRVQLLAQEVSAELADELIRELSQNLTGAQLADGPLSRAKLAELIALRVMTVSDAPAPGAQGTARVLAFIGPTGVGKTTTIAKLAANFKLREHKKVGLITIDTYRIAAVDQLKTYAEIIEVPLQVVLTAGELRQSIESMKDCDMILIDTAGRSQNDRLRLSQLSAFLKAAGPDEIHLVIAATANRAAIVGTLERFMPLGVNRIIMSKLDEASALGAVLNVAAAGKLPLSYVTIGQDVPDDIAPADPCRLAQCIMEGNRYVHG